ncbi:MAG: class I SAM-dependent methyltransferase [Coriobacteriia bacterium]|nr:class I SAM-dependent methyltransferase [Coriobacteriia bacterium]
MDNETVRILNQATAAFYRRNAESFSLTRHGAWAGWVRALDALPESFFSAGGPVSVLDVACGNLRFERFLRERYPDCAFRVHAVDSCAPLVGECPADVRFRELDVLGALAGDAPGDAIEAPPCSLVVCFGFLHHVPAAQNRVRLLRELADKTAPDGYAIVSFWQFANSGELLRKARESHARGLAALAPCGLDASQLEEGDYLLGWQDTCDTFRYCHAFAPGEALELARQAGLADRVVASYEADGRTGNLNAYLVIRDAFSLPKA